MLSAAAIQQQGWGLRMACHHRIPHGFRLLSQRCATGAVVLGRGDDHTSPLWAGAMRFTTAPTLRDTPPSLPRKHGVVASFMHRRGYGFLLEDCSPPQKYFFPRVSLMGKGHYVEAGQRVSFIASPAPSPVANNENADGAESASNGAAQLQVAKRIKLLSADGRESNVVPTSINGIVDVWDPITGTGVIAELDIHGDLHPEAPRFTLSLEDSDLPSSGCFAEKCLVRFCIDPESPTVARRVILDFSRENNLRADSSGRQPPPPKPPTRQQPTRSALRMGTIREVRESFGFITDDETARSIFFHKTAVESAGKGAEAPSIVTGDVVTYYLETASSGKHAGKPLGVGIRKVGEGSSAPTPRHSHQLPTGGGSPAPTPRAAAASAPASTSAAEELEEEDFESFFMDESPLEPTAVVAAPSSPASIEHVTPPQGQQPTQIPEDTRADAVAPSTAAARTPKRSPAQKKKKVEKKKLKDKKRATASKVSGKAAKEAVEESVEEV